MKNKVLKFIFLALTFLLLPGVVLAQDTGWVITNFNSDVFIPQDGRVRVVEEIKVDFGTLQKHGIFRDIPTEDIKFKLLEVTQDGEGAITKVSKSFRETSIRIGDPDETISGAHTYRITYEVGGVISRFDEYDEFYWDVTGNGWPVPIESSSATVTLEGGEVQEVLCFTGEFGSQEENCTARVEAGNGEFSTTSSLAPSEGLTMVNKIPKGLVGDPIWWEDILRWGWVVLGSLVALGFVLKRWLEHGRDMWYKGHVIDDPDAEAGVKPLFASQTVVPEFEPPEGLRPGEVGTLVDEKIDMRDVSATIVDLAVQGYLKIIEEEKGKYTFKKLKDFGGDGELLEFELEVLRGLFEEADEVALSDLENKFYTKLKPIKDSLYQRLDRENYFVGRPDKVRGRYLAVGIGILFIFGVLLFVREFDFSSLWPALPFGFLGILLVSFSSFMPKKTAKGTEAVRRSSGLKLFISTGQKYQQQFNERINRFDEFLPYAMVFGVVDKWAKAFEKLGIEPPQPSWYSGYGVFRMSQFSRSVQAMENSMAQTFPSSPSKGGGSGFSSGGGFSGGGFGGGGGGSW